MGMHQVRPERGLLLHDSQVIFFRGEFLQPEAHQVTMHRS